MKKLILMIFLIASTFASASQKDSLYAKKQADSLIKCSDVQLQTGMYDKAIETLLKANVIADSCKLDNHKYKILQVLSGVFMLKKEYNKALDYANSSLKVSLTLNNYYNIGWSYSRIANVMLETNDYAGAETNYTKSLEAFNKINDMESKAVSMNNLGLLYQKQNKLDKAEKSFLGAYEISKTIKYFMLQVYAEMELGDLYRLKKDYEKAKKYFDLALKDEKQTKYTVLTQSLFNTLHEFYKETGDYNKSLVYFEKYSILTDSLNRVNQDQRILETETKFRTKEKEKEITFLNKENDLQQSQIKKRNIILGLSCLVIFVIGGLIIVIYRSRKKQVLNNKALSQKNQEIEHQKKEIVDSINYAKRIQDASLGNPNKIKELYSNSAILFQPKDILSGDFYWFNKIGNKFMFSVADCTGHGVPGAMMSMIGNNGLNDAITKKLESPAEILNHLSEYVNKNFIKTDMDVKDGMDIAFCSLNTETGELTYSGAINSLYIYNGVEVIDIKADKNYIGQPESKYTEHKIQLRKGDCVYIMSDGYVDQFGGENNKKFKISNFKTLVKDIGNKEIDVQNEVFYNTLKTWKENYEQTDDICLISVKF